jgi:nicotinamide-nucleotide amidase
MRCDVLAVGTELLLGQIIDSNSAWMGSELALHGIDSLVQVKVGDNIGRIEVQLRRMLVDADAVIMCGGLGPTHDDLTRSAIAAVMGVELVEDPALVEVIRAMFESRGRVMAESNRQQAEVPVGASIIAQTRGTAPGLICPIMIDGVAKVVYAVPGVPHEMKDMIHRAIIPDLLERSGERAVIASRVLRTWGESESGLNERLDAIIDQLETPDTPTLAFLASGWNGLKVRLTAKDKTADDCAAQLDYWEAVVREEIDEFVFGTDEDTMESVVLDLCRQRGLTLAVAESVTGGLVGGRLTDIPGASDVFVGGVVSYATSVKQQLLGVSDGPVVSESAAREMAAGVRERLGADIGLALTGVAGPDEQDGQRVGTLFVGMVGPGFEEVRQVQLPGIREQMRQFSVITALGFLRHHLDA